MQTNKNMYIILPDPSGPGLQSMCKVGRDSLNWLTWSSTIFDSFNGANILPSSSGWSLCICEEREEEGEGERQNEYTLITCTCTVGVIIFKVHVFWNNRIIILLHLETQIILELDFKLVNFFIWQDNHRATEFSIPTRADARDKQTEKKRDTIYLWWSL